MPCAFVTSVKQASAVQVHRAGKVSTHPHKGQCIVAAPHHSYNSHQSRCLPTALSASGCSPLAFNQPSKTFKHLSFISSRSRCSPVRVFHICSAGRRATLNIAASSSSPACCSNTVSVDKMLYASRKDLSASTGTPAHTRTAANKQRGSAGLKLRQSDSQATSQCLHVALCHASAKAIAYLLH